MRIFGMTISVFAMMMLISCNIIPQKIPPTPGDNAMLEKIRHDIKFNTNVSGGWQWILWYIPFAFVVCAWAYKEFLVKKHNEPPKEEQKPTEEPPKQ